MENKDDLIEILRKKNGANFYWADLHIHTPFWDGFKLPSGVKKDDENWKKQFAKKYIEKAQERDITILGITEHNDVSWIDYIRQAAAGTEITVFPGFEITTQSGADGIHILCLFNPDITKDTLDGLLSNLGLLPGQRFHDKSPRAVTKDMKEIIEAIKKQEGICIAAHVSSNNGLLAKTEGQIRVNLFTNTDLLAVEIPAGREALGNFEKKAISNELDHYKRKFPIACINSSDAKSIDDIGTKRSLIKISSFTAEGLREAFLDWRSRIRLEDEQPQQPPRFSKILAVKWDGGFLNGISSHFNKNLNCIIGGKGTGKSTVIETLRYVFDEKSKADKIEEQHNEILHEVFRSGSKISVLVEAHQPLPRKYIIERIYPESPVVKEIDGSPRGDLKPKDIFRIEIYGQKEIYEISKDRQFQFRILERFVGDRLITFKEEEKDILEKLEENKSDLLRLERSITSAEERIAILPSLEEKIKAYKQMGIEDNLREKRQYSREEQLLKQGLEKLEQFTEQLNRFHKGIDLDASFLLQGNINELPNRDVLKEAGEIIEILSKEIETHISEMRRLLEDAINRYDGKQGVLTNWQELNKKQNERYAKILRSLQERFKTVDPDELIQLEKKVEQLKLIKQEKEKYDIQYKEMERERDNLLIRLQDNKSSQYRIRQEVMNELNKKLDGILRVKLEYQGEKQEFVKRLRLLKSGAKEEQLNRIVEGGDFSIIAFTRSIREGPSSLAQKYGIAPATAQSLCKSISQEELYNLETFEIQTKATLALNLGSKEAPNYRNIEHLSVGQKCTALLTLILLENPYPLVVDQPEDDLDNTFIVNDIVNRLRREKEHRQFIIATHNANIPVLGGAELIIPLEATANQARVEEGLYGSIDDEPVKEIVMKTLEGGKEAFEIRKEKYGI
jgi:energy-coupling factor transporter ATP-binding protein EcfA2